MATKTKTAAKTTSNKKPATKAEQKKEAPQNYVAKRMRAVRLGMLSRS
jgi:hypothetical protein